MIKLAKKGKSATSSAETAATAAVAADDIFPAVETPQLVRTGRVWSCVDNNLTISVSALDGVVHQDSAPWLEAHISRPSDDVLRFEMRSNHEGKQSQDSEWGKFFVPIEVVPYLSGYFAEIARRLEAEGMMQPGDDYMSVNVEMLPGAAQ